MAEPRIIDQLYAEQRRRQVAEQRYAYADEELARIADICDAYGVDPNLALESRVRRLALDGEEGAHDR